MHHKFDVNLEDRQGKEKYKGVYDLNSPEAGNESYNFETENDIMIAKRILPYMKVKKKLEDVVINLGKNFH
jgi:hypothetical protein